MSQVPGDTQAGYYYNAGDNQAERDKGSFTKFLDAEIERLRSESRQPGWTKWALLGGIASIAWLMLERVERGTSDLANVGLLAVLLSIFFDACGSLGILIQPEQTSLDHRSRIVLTNRSWGAGRMRSLLVMLRALALIAVTYLVRDRILRPYSSIVYVVYGLTALLFVLFLALTYLPFPLPAHPGLSLGARLVLLAGFAATGMPVVGYSISALRSPVGVTPDDIRLAALLVALYYLVWTLAGLGLSTPILGALLAIRRQLALERIDLRTAIRQTDVALTGLEVSDVLQDNITQLLDLWSRMGSELRQASVKLEAMRRAIRWDPEAEYDETEAAMIESLVQSIVSHGDSVVEIDRRIGRGVESFRRRASLICRVSTSARTAVNEIVNELVLAGRNAARQAGDLEREAEALLQSIEEILRSAES